MRKTGLTGSTHYLWDEDDLVMELDGAGAVLREYSYYLGIDQPHSVRIPSDQNRIYYYVPELPGHVAGLTSEAHEVANAYEYTPFGESIPLDINTWMSQPLGFGARDRDQDSGLYFLRVRYYDPELGRFISEDPIRLGGGINPYVYTGDDPTNATDPLGMCGIYSGTRVESGIVFKKCEDSGPYDFQPGKLGRGVATLPLGPTIGPMRSAGEMIGPQGSGAIPDVRNPHPQTQCNAARIYLGYSAIIDAVGAAGIAASLSTGPFGVAAAEASRLAVMRGAMLLGYPVLLSEVGMKDAISLTGGMLMSNAIDAMYGSYLGQGPPTLLGAAANVIGNFVPGPGTLAALHMYRAVCQ